MLQKPCLRWGKIGVNIVASRFNNKLNKFVAKTRDPIAFTVDALVIP